MAYLALVNPAYTGVVRARYLQVSDATSSRRRPGDWRRRRDDGGGAWPRDGVQQLDGHWRRTAAATAAAAAGAAGRGSEEVERVTGTRLRDWAFDEIDDAWRRRRRRRTRLSVETELTCTHAHTPTVGCRQRARHGYTHIHGYFVASYQIKSNQIKFI